MEIRATFKSLKACLAALPTSPKINTLPQSKPELKHITCCAASVSVFERQHIWISARYVVAVRYAPNSQPWKVAGGRARKIKRQQSPKTIPNLECLL